MKKAQKFRIGGKKYRIPPPSRFDTLTDPDLYTAAEQALANSIQALDRFRREDTDEAVAYLHLALAHLETAQLAVASMARRAEVERMLQ
jgi:hypothetical protein